MWVLALPLTLYLLAGLTLGRVAARSYYRKIQAERPALLGLAEKKLERAEKEHRRYQRGLSTLGPYSWEREELEKLEFEVQCWEREVKKLAPNPRAGLFGALLLAAWTALTWVPTGLLGMLAFSVRWIGRTTLRLLVPEYVEQLRERYSAEQASRIDANATKIERAERGLSGDRDA